MPPSQKVSFNQVRSGFFFSLIVILGLAMVYLFRPFFYPLIWAVIVAVFFRPVYIVINKYIRHPTISSIITIALVLLVIILPLFFISLLVIRQSFDLYNSAIYGAKTANAQNILNWLGHTAFAPYVKQIQEGWAEYAVQAGKAISSFAFAALKQITENLLRFVAMFLLMIYTLYYFLKDGSRMLKRLVHLSPLGDEYEQMLLDKFISTVRATIKGTLVIGLIQGFLAFILFSLTHVEAPLIWAILLAMTAMVPGLGAFIVWFPLGIIMLALGNIWEGLTILVVGALVLSLIDNIIRPPLVGKDIQMHPVLVLFSTLGGVLVFGFSGLIIGPILAALFMSVVSIYDLYYRKELSNN